MEEDDLDITKIITTPVVEDPVEPEQADNEEDDIPYIDGANGYSKLQMSDVRNGQKSVDSISLHSSIANVSEIGGRQVDEEQAEGGIAWLVWKSYFTAGNNICFLIFTVLVLILSQVVTSGSDYFVTFWTHQEYLRLIKEATLFSTIDGLWLYGILIIGVIIVSLYNNFLIVLI